jgi:hypothetical protein
MKKRTFSWADKLKTLWASIEVGCNHTSEINSKLGSHERAAARMLGLVRFPDQSQVNRLLWAFKASTSNNGEGFTSICCADTAGPPHVAVGFS